MGRLGRTQEALRACGPRGLATTLGAWADHPNAEILNKTDCLHFCVAGDGRRGVYETLNRRWWSSMLAGGFDS